MLSNHQKSKSLDSFLELHEILPQIESTTEGRSAVLLALPSLRNNRRLKRIVEDEAYELYLQEKEDGNAVDDNGNPLTFLQWMLEHREQILSLISFFSKLFGI